MENPACLVFSAIRTLSHNRACNLAVKLYERRDYRLLAWHYHDCYRTFFLFGRPCSLDRGEGRKMSNPVDQLDCHGVSDLNLELLPESAVSHLRGVLG